jgi:hypothetical protein
MTSKPSSGCSTAILMCVAWYSTQAMADGECAKGYRDTTAAERATMKTVLVAALAALPPAPTGWSLTADGETQGLRSVCRDVEAQPFSYSTRRFLNRVDDRDAREQALKAALAPTNAAQAAKQPRIDALNAKLEDIGKKIGEAVTKGDMTRAEALNKEADAVGQQLQAVFDENDQTAQLEAAGREHARDTEIDMEVTVNPPRATPGTGAKPLAKPAGVHSAYRWSDDPAQGTQDHALLLLGAWKAVDNHFESTARNGAASAAASSLSIRIDADPQRIQSLISALKIGDLAATLH